MEPVSPALAGVFFTTEPPGRPAAEKSVWPLHKGNTSSRRVPHFVKLSFYYQWKNNKGAKHSKLTTS